MVAAVCTRVELTVLFRKWDSAHGSNVTSGSERRVRVPRVGSISWARGWGQWVS